MGVGTGAVYIEPCPLGVVEDTKRGTLPTRKPGVAQHGGAPEGRATFTDSSQLRRERAHFHLALRFSTRAFLAARLTAR